jgi:hypothetical protein
MINGEYTAMDFYREEGVKDITPMRARGFFAKALAAEANAGKTTPEAEALLDEAIKELGE